MKKSLFISIGIILLYLSPLVILGENAYINAFDNLDSHITYFKVLTQSGMMFGALDSVIPQIMNGLPRSAFVSEFNFLALLFYAFKPFTAYVINEFLMHFVAFFGMYLLLKKHILKNSDNNFAIIAASLTFALLPFFPSRGLGIAAQPLALYAFLNIKNDKFSIYDFIILFLLPFYSSLVFSAAFFLFALYCLFSYDVIQKRKINYRLLLCLGCMSLLHIVAEYRLIYGMFFDNSFISHREEFSPIIGDNPAKFAFKNFLSGAGQPWTKSFHSPFILAALIPAFFINWKKPIRENLLFVLTLISVIMSVIYGLIVSPLIIPIEEKLSIFKVFQFQRFCSLLPLIWYCIFGISLSVIISRFKHGLKCAKALVLCQIVFLFISYPAIKNEFRNIFHIKHPYLTYKQYYSESLFGKVRDYIGKDQSSYRVASLGIEPSAALYNGFYTLDAYVNNYSLDYKHKFRKIIEGELEKASNLGHFDERGNKCYIFSSELRKSILKMKNPEKFEIKNLAFNTEAFKDLSGKYLFSAVKISNAKEIELKFMGKFEDKYSLYKVYLYSVN